jgi:hypothetical protein
MIVADSVGARRRLVPIRDPVVRELTGHTPLSTLYELARYDPPRLAGVVRVGRRVLIDVEKLESWIEAGGARVKSA